VVHCFWLVKSDITRPTQYAVAVGILLLYRLAVWLADRQMRPQPVRSASNLSPTDAS